jgi:hypothetical protein
LTLPGGERVDIPRHLWFPSAMTVLSLFLGGLYLGKLIGGPPDAGAAFVTTLTVRGQVVKVSGKPVRVLVPAKTIIRDGKVIPIPPTTIDLTQAGRTVVSTQTVPTTVSQTETVPTTVTETSTVPTTVTTTATVTDTVTVTGTGTTTVSSSVTVP